MIRLNELNECHHCGTDGYGGPQDGCAKDTYHINGIPAKNAFPKSSHEKNIRDTQNKGHSNFKNKGSYVLWSEGLCPHHQIPVRNKNVGPLGGD